MRSFLIAALLALNSCRGLTESRTTTGVQMSLDKSCARFITKPTVFTLTVDAVVLGSATLSVGDTSAPFGVRPGLHAISAASSVIWYGAVNYDVPVQGIVYVMSCPF